MTLWSRRTWPVLMACGIALAAGQAAGAAEGDAHARRVAFAQESAVKAQFVAVQSCVNANSAPCLQNAAFVFYGVAARARTKVAALRKHALNASVRSGIDLLARTLALHVQHGYELYTATELLDIRRIHRALTNIRSAFTMADRAIARMYS